MIQAQEILCSENAQGSRLMTMLARYPKFIHAEHTRHRAFSFSVSSSRAIPVSKNLEEVRDANLRASPVFWAKEQKGMSGFEELDSYELIYTGRDGYGCSEREAAKQQWRTAALHAANNAEHLAKIGAHKSIVNRILEPFLHVNVLVTGTTPGWMNFFGLRLDKAAQPEMRVLAEEMWKVWNESKPQKLEPGQWHLPFIQFPKEVEELNIWQARFDPNNERLTAQIEKDITEGLIRISVARCARLSYLSFETNKRSTIEEDLKLYDRLVGSSPIHASPAEHQATPDVLRVNYNTTIQDHISGKDGIWDHPEQAGNLGHGWRQYRKMLPNEVVASLPEEYKI